LRVKSTNQGFLHIKMDQIVGRKEEIKLLERLKVEQTPAFVAFYGRRRVGKTYLVREVMQNDFAFYITGVENISNKVQLGNFKIAIERRYPAARKWPAPKDWFAAFELLRDMLEAMPEGKKVVFLDELPWFDKPKSNFVSALEYFWNGWASARRDLMLICCGSAASWMLSNLINQHGGLHNRVTHRVQLEPFTLAECEEFFKAKGAAFTRKQIVQLYMVMGGVPFYLDQVDASQSVPQNINRICFSTNGLLRTEFDNLFASLYKRPENHLSIITVLAQKTSGLTREAIISESKTLRNGGTLTKTLTELEESGFVLKYRHFGNKSKAMVYRLSDFYSAFYLRFIANTEVSDQNAWTDQLDDPAIRAWSGYAYEQVCLAHIRQIKQALGIGNVRTQASTWYGTDGSSKAQIDLLIDRRDEVINLCEIKWAVGKYTIDKAYADQLRQKMMVFRAATQTEKALYLTMITSLGLVQNQYASELVIQSLTLDDLF
jgi:uncharacterized protein